MGRTDTITYRMADFSRKHHPISSDVGQGSRRAVGDLEKMPARFDPHYFRYA